MRFKGWWLGFFCSAHSDTASGNGKFSCSDNYCNFLSFLAYKVFWGWVCLGSPPPPPPPSEWGFNSLARNLQCERRLGKALPAPEMKWMDIHPSIHPSISVSLLQSPISQPSRRLGLKGRGESGKDPPLPCSPISSPCLIAGVVCLSCIIALTAHFWQGLDPRLMLLAGRREGEGPEYVLNTF